LGKGGSIVIGTKVEVCAQVAKIGLALDSGTFVVPLGFGQESPGLDIGSESEAFVVSHLGTNVSEVLHAKLHGIDGASSMARAGSMKKQVISENTRVDITFTHEEDPGSHNESNHGHAEGAPLRDRAPMLVRSPNCVTNLVPDIHLVNVPEVGIEHLGRHTGMLCNLIDEFPVDLVKAFIDINRTPRYLLIRKVGELHLQGSIEPSILSSFAWGTGKELRDIPLLDPGGAIPNMVGGPLAIPAGGDFEDSVSQRILSILRVL